MIALRAYLDSSGKLGDDYITLAAIAANSEMWEEFEVAWARILDAHSPKAPYIHMREIFRLVKGFDASLGWDRKGAFELASQCWVYMSHLDKKRFRMFYCTVDLRAWRNLRSETYQMPEPTELCNQFCSEVVLGWYLKYYPDIINVRTDTVKYFFDQNEYFYQPFFDKWNRVRSMSKATGKWSLWDIVEDVAAVEMRKTPGIQAADMIAWGMNRETFAREGDIAKHMGHIIRQVIPAFHIVWDEAKLREQFNPLLYLP